MGGYQVERRNARLVTPYLQMHPLGTPEFTLWAPQ